MMNNLNSLTFAAKKEKEKLIGASNTKVTSASPSSYNDLYSELPSTSKAAREILAAAKIAASVSPSPESGRAANVGDDLDKEGATGGHPTLIDTPLLNLNGLKAHLMAEESKLGPTSIGDDAALWLSKSCEHLMQKLLRESSFAARARTSSMKEETSIPRITMDDLIFAMKRDKRWSGSSTLSKALLKRGYQGN